MTFSPRFIPSFQPFPSPTDLVGSMPLYLLRSWTFRNRYIRASRLLLSFWSIFPVPHSYCRCPPPAQECSTLAILFVICPCWVRPPSWQRSFFLLQPTPIPHQFLHDAATLQWFSSCIPWSLLSASLRCRSVSFSHTNTIWFECCSSPSFPFLCWSPRTYLCFCTFRQMLVSPTET